MVAVFPIGKLVYLGIKQVSKPFARALQNYARRNKFMREYICIPPAQAYHKLQIFVRMRLMGSKAPVEVQPLAEEKAVEMGSELLGELLLFSIGVGYISYEYFKSVQKGKDKEDSQDNLIAKLNDKVNEMEAQLKSLKIELENSKLEKKVVDTVKSHTDSGMKKTA